MADMNHELGVEFRCVFRGTAHERTLDCFIDFLESKGWQYGGGWQPTEMSGVVEFKVNAMDQAERCKAELLVWFEQADWIESVPEIRLIDLDELNAK